MAHVLTLSDLYQSARSCLLKLRSSTGNGTLQLFRAAWTCAVASEISQSKGPPFGGPYRKLGIMAFGVYGRTTFLSSSKSRFQVFKSVSVPKARARALQNKLRPILHCKGVENLSGGRGL